MSGKGSLVLIDGAYGSELTLISRQSVCSWY